jgi:hypothetical protein
MRYERRWDSRKCLTTQSNSRSLRLARLSNPSSGKATSDQLNKLKFGSDGEWKKSAEIIGGVVAGIGVAMVGASAVVAKQVFEQVKEMPKLSQSYRLPVEAISKLRVAAAITGVSLETLTMGMGRLAHNAATAAEGGKMQALAETLGVKVTDGAGHLHPMNDLLLDVSGKFSKLQDGTGKTALAMQLFGRSGAAVIPFLDRGSVGIKQLLDLSDQLGMTWSKEDAEAAEIFKERLELLDLKSTAMKENFVKGIASTELGRARGLKRRPLASHPHPC